MRRRCYHWINRTPKDEKLKAVENIQKEIDNMSPEEMKQMEKEMKQMEKEMKEALEKALW